MIKHVNGRDISLFHTVKVRPNLGASTHDLLDYVKPAMRKKLKALVIHTGMNDIQQEINTMKMFKKLEDHDFRDQIEEINGKLNRYCESKGYRFVENSNIDGGFLNRIKLHLTKRVRLCLVGILPMFSNIFYMHLIVMVSLSILKFLVTMKCLVWTV